MTDITELAQSLKAAAEKALQGKWEYEAGAIWYTDESGWVRHMAAVEAGDGISDEEHKSNMQFITTSTPAVVLEFLEELSKLQISEANESDCADNVIDLAIKWQIRCKDAESKLEAAENRNLSLVEALEKAQQEHRLHAARLISEKALLKERIAELEEAEQKLCAANVTLDARAELAERRLAEREQANAAQDDHINQQQERIEQLEKRNAELGKYAKELESFRTAYMEWSDKTDWVQGDKRFDVLIPWGKHRADVLKAYIEHLESRTVTVKLPKDHVDDADLFGWGVVVVPLEALKEACADAGVTVEIADAGIKWEAE